MSTTPGAPASTDATVAATVLRMPDGRLLGYAQYGDPAGAPMFAFHGTPGSRTQLALMDEPARRRGIRVLVTDRPGYGFSDPHPGRRLADWPLDVCAVADHLGIGRFAVMGVSGGAPHALTCAAMLPDRVTDVHVVSGVAPPACWVPGARPPRAERFAFRLFQRGGLGLVVLAAPWLWLARRAPRVLLALYQFLLPVSDRRILRDPAIVPAFVDEMRRQSRTTARSLAQDLELFVGPWGIDLGDIHQPVMVWHGGRDRAVPVEHAHALVMQLPRARIRVFPSDGHLMLQVRVDTVLGAVDTPPSSGLGPLVPSATAVVGDTVQSHPSQPSEATGT